MTIIEAIELRTILDSRGNPTVEAEISTSGGFGRAAAPSGASTGAAEAKVLPPAAAIEHATQNLIPALIGLDSSDQEGFDDQLRDIDGTADFSGIGANVAVALSLANAKAAASALGFPLFRYLGGAFVREMPLPLGNVIGGGAHAANATEIQEFLVVPGGAADAEEAVFANAAVHRIVKDLLKKKGIAAGKGDEGAWAPQIDDALAFELIAEATGRVEDEMNVSVDMGIDVAASQMWTGSGYSTAIKSAQPRTRSHISPSSSTNTISYMSRIPFMKMILTLLPNLIARLATDACCVGMISLLHRSTALSRVSKPAPPIAYLSSQIRLAHSPILSRLSACLTPMVWIP